MILHVKCIFLEFLFKSSLMLFSQNCVRKQKTFFLSAHTLKCGVTALLPWSDVEMLMSQENVALGLGVECLHQ